MFTSYETQYLMTQESMGIQYFLKLNLKWEQDQSSNLNMSWNSILAGIQTQKESKKCKRKKKNANISKNDHNSKTELITI